MSSATINTDQTERSARHILSLSGGKDSSALAVYMRDRVPQMEYVFCDTGSELKETYDFLDKLEAYLGKPIVRLRPDERIGANNGLRVINSESDQDRPFKHYLGVYNGVLPDARARWCTRMLKLKPFERYVGDDFVINYVGIRGDENRRGLISTKPNIQTKFPFVEDNICKSDVEQILQESGLGFPEYYKWRSRSGCYFCFFQQRIEWVGLLENHPDLFMKAMAFEKENTGYSWNQREFLRDLMKPERIAEIKEDYKRRQASMRSNEKNWNHLPTYLQMTRKMVTYPA